MTFSCFHKFNFLSKDRTCEWLANAINEACRELDYALWAYVFMPDHLHLVIYPHRFPYDTSEFLKRIKEPVSRNAIAFLKDEAPEWLGRIRVKHGDRIEHRFWQSGRGFDRNIDNARTLQKIIDYIHENPVRKGLVTDPRLWKWSSAGWFAGAPLNDLEPDPIPVDWLEE